MKYVFQYNTRLLTTYTYFIGLMNLGGLRCGWLAIFSITWRSFVLPSPYNPPIPLPPPPSPKTNSVTLIFIRNWKLKFVLGNPIKTKLDHFVLGV